MSDFVGVIPAIAFVAPNELKRLLLMFQRLALDLTAQRLSIPERDALRVGKKAFDYLNSEGLLTTIDGARADARENMQRHTADPRFADVLNLKGLGRALGTTSGRLHTQGVTGRENLRQTALRLRRTEGLDAVAVGDERAINIDAKAERSDVVRITLQSLPVPTDTTPWEAILSFRRDPESRNQHARMKAWINKAASQKAKQHELHDELREMLADYEQFMALHEIQARGELVEVLVVAGSGEYDSAQPRMVTADFSLQRQRAALLEAEMQAPGRAVAYILKARRHFDPSSSVFS